MIPSARRNSQELHKRYIRMKIICCRDDIGKYSGNGINIWSRETSEELSTYTGTDRRRDNSPDMLV